jgi:hypothetical protein
MYLLADTLIPLISQIYRKIICIKKGDPSSLESLNREIRINTGIQDDTYRITMDNRLTQWNYDTASMWE